MQMQVAATAATEEMLKVKAIAAIRRALAGTKTKIKTIIKIETTTRLCLKLATAEMVAMAEKLTAIVSNSVDQDGDDNDADLVNTGDANADASGGDGGDGGDAEAEEEE